MSRALGARLLALATAALLAGLLPGSATAQATITGQVLDATTNAPIADVLVGIIELRRSVKTDSAGSFTLSGLTPGSYRWSVVRLGYVPLDQQMELRDGDHFRVGVMRRPAPTEAPSVAENRTAEHFRRRMNSALVPVRLLTGEALRETPAGRADELLADWLELRDCPGEVAAAKPGADCVAARGRVQPLSLFIDEIPVLGGVFQLAAFEPEELYAVELWSGGAEVRVFTQRFVQALAEGRAQFEPRG